MKIMLQLFGGRGTGSGISKYYLPKDPAKSSKLKDVTHPRKRERTIDRTYRDEYLDLEMEFHPGKKGQDGWKGKNHYHVKNPNSTGRHDYYLDKDGNPCSRGSDRSHLTPGEYEFLLRSLNKWKVF